jgi:hypothetical protein
MQYTQLERDVIGLITEATITAGDSKITPEMLDLEMLTGSTKEAILAVIAKHPDKIVTDNSTGVDRYKATAEFVKSVTNAGGTKDDLEDGRSRVDSRDL